MRRFRQYTDSYAFLHVIYYSVRRHESVWRRGLCMAANQQQQYTLAWPITATYVILSHRGPNEPCGPKLFSEVRIGATWWIRWIDLCSGSDAVCRCHYCSRRAYQPAWRSLRYRPIFRTRCRVSQMSLEFVVITNLFQHFTATLKCIDRCNRTVKDNKHVCFCCVEFSFFGTSLWHRCKKRSNKNKKKR